MLPPRRRAPQRSSKRKKETTLLKYQKNKTRKEKNERIPVQSQEEAVQNENGCVEEVEDETTRLLFRCVVANIYLLVEGLVGAELARRPAHHAPSVTLIGGMSFLRVKWVTLFAPRPIYQQTIAPSPVLFKVARLCHEPWSCRSILRKAEQAGLSSRTADLPASAGFTPLSWSSATAGLSSKLDWQTSRVLAS